MEGVVLAEAWVGRHAFFVMIFECAAERVAYQAGGNAVTQGDEVRHAKL
jgi:hypothetical protein